VDDEAIRVLVRRLARPDPSGGEVIERAAIMAAGADFAAVMEWVIAHGGAPETTVAAAPSGGLHSSRLSDGRAAASQTARRFVLPPGALT
jgi:hypothetical protein